MPSGQLKKHLTKTALNYYTFPFFTAILFMPFKFGRVRVLVPSMTCSKFKNPLFVLSLALHTILTRNHFLKSLKSHTLPDHISFAKLQFTYVEIYSKNSSRLLQCHLGL